MVKDICPNCGQACATTDVLCPNCGKNLDELFEQLPDSEIRSLILPKWMNFLMKAKASRTWRVLNSLALAIAFLAPWEVGYIDVGPSKPIMIVGWQVILYSIPDNLLNIYFFSCLYCVVNWLIAIGYLSLVIYSVLSFLQASNLHSKSRFQNLQKVSNFCVIASGLIFLRIVFPLLATTLIWGYWLACVGLLSSLWLETVELISSKGVVDSSVPKAA